MSATFTCASCSGVMMMTTEGIWEALERDVTGQSFEGMALRRLIPTSRRNLFQGVTLLEKKRLLVLRVEPEAIPPSDVLTDTGGLEVRAAALSKNDRAHNSLILTLKDKRDTDIFNILVEDMAAAVSPTQDDHEAVSIFVGRLKKWQRFLEEKHGQGLGAEARRGLYGELWFLREFVLPMRGPDGITSWTGCHHTPQDFMFAHGAIEVKTTISQAPQKVIISSARQLDDTGLEQLFLAHIPLQLMPAGETLPGIISSIRAVLADNSWQRNVYELSLLEAGYYDAHASNYETEGYAHREIYIFRVGDGFPHLRECDLVSGIGDVTYSITIAAYQNFQVPTEMVKGFLQTP